MSSLIRLGAALFATLPLVAAEFTGPLSSPKRGLVYTPNITTPEDNRIWVQKPTSLTWYYNYGEFPSSVFSDIPQSEFEFVPMMWGVPEDVNNITFVDSIKSVIDQGTNITHVLSFNEPDMISAWGGSNLAPDRAAQAWVNNFIPLRRMGLKVGLPACAGHQGGLDWTLQFLDECSKLISDGDNKKNCSFDFIPLHYYGDFGGMADHMGKFSAAFPNKTFWITEYNMDHQDLLTTQDFYNMSAEYFDRLDFVERYSLFGAFRSDVSNVGPNAAMLNRDGELTDIGAWYLGRQGTGVDPQSGVGVTPKGAAAALGDSRLSSAMVGSVVAAIVFLAL